jgi:hypothetical protein
VNDAASKFIAGAQSDAKKEAQIRGKVTPTKQGCQIFFGTIYQNEKNIPQATKIYTSNVHNIYQIFYKIYQKAMKYTFSTFSS